MTIQHQPALLTNPRVLTVARSNDRFWHKADRLTELKVRYEREADVRWKLRGE